jgi:DNA-binding transcriptional MerR regulator
MDEDEDEGEDDDSDDMHNPRRAGFRARVEDMRPLTRRAAAARLHITPNTLRRWEKEGKIRATLKDGKAWYDPQDVEEMAEEHDGEEVGSAQLLTSAGRIIAQQMAHTEAILSTYVSTTAQILEMQGAIVKELRVQNKDLLDEKMHARALIDQAQSEETERSMMMLESQARIQRADKLIDAAKTLAPTVIGLLAKKKGDPAAGLNPAVESLIGSLTQEQAFSILSSGVLTENQIAAFAMLYESMKPSEMQKMKEQIAESQAAAEGKV